MNVREEMLETGWEHLVLFLCGGSLIVVGLLVISLFNFGWERLGCSDKHED